MKAAVYRRYGFPRRRVGGRFLRDKADLQPGQTIVINGASGAVGAAAVQLARHFGATVTGVCSGAGHKKGNVIITMTDHP